MKMLFTSTENAILSSFKAIRWAFKCLFVSQGLIDRPSPENSSQSEREPLLSSALFCLMCLNHIIHRTTLLTQSTK